MSGSSDLRVLLVGGDAAASVALSTALRIGHLQVVVARATDPSSLAALGRDVDAIVVVTRRSDPDPMQNARLIAEAGLQNRCVVIGDETDIATALQAVEAGFRGFLVRGSSPEHLGRAIRQVIRHGAVYDAPAAALLGTTTDLDPLDDGLMGAARALASALELKDTYTGGHAERVTSLALRMTRSVMGGSEADDPAYVAAFLLHDVGKIGIPDSILTKPAGLTDMERRVLETHPILGERIIAPLGFPEVVQAVVRHHHERWDGMGYPDRLCREEIPLPARIFAIADVIDAMTSIRPYRRPVRFEDAIQEIAAQGGSQFDPDLAALAGEIFLDASIDLPVG